MVVDVRPDLDLFDMDDLLLLLGLVRLLLLLVEELAEVHDAADRRLGGRSDLDQVEPLRARPRQSLLDGDDPRLPALLIHQAHLAHPDPLVDPRRLVDTQLTPWERRASARMVRFKMSLPPLKSLSASKAPAGARCGMSRAGFDLERTPLRPGRHGRGDW